MIACIFCNSLVLKGVQESIVYDVRAKKTETGAQRNPLRTRLCYNRKLNFQRQKLPLQMFSHLTNNTFTVICDLDFRWESPRKGKNLTLKFGATGVRDYIHCWFSTPEKSKSSLKSCFTSWMENETATSLLGLFRRSPASKWMSAFCFCLVFLLWKEMLLGWVWGVDYGNKRNPWFCFP